MKSLKKGMGVTRKFPSQTDALGVSWYHNWMPAPEADLEAEFVPMIWGKNNVNPEIIAYLKANKFPALLAFNEPDSKGEANMTAEEAVSLWPKLMETGLRLGSPAPREGAGEGQWLHEFMRAVAAGNLRVDFICLHWHGEINKPDAHEKLMDFLEQVHKLYGKPIWLTDFGAWNKSQEFTLQQVSEYMTKALPILESLPFVERYAWFASYTRFGMWPDWHLSSLLDFSGKLTPLGIQYRDFSP